MSQDQINTLCAAHIGKRVTVSTAPPRSKKYPGVGGIELSHQGVLRGVEHRVVDGLGIKSFFRYVLLKTKDQALVEIPECCVMDIVSKGKAKGITTKRITPAEQL